MRTGFDDLDSIINLSEPQLILIPELIPHNDYDCNIDYLFVNNILHNIGIEQNIPSAIFSFDVDDIKTRVCNLTLEMDWSLVKATYVLEECFEKDVIKKYRKGNKVQIPLNDYIDDEEKDYGVISEYVLSERKIKKFENEKYNLDNSNLYIEEIEDVLNFTFDNFKERCINQKKEKDIRIIGIVECIDLTQDNYSLTIKKLADLARELDVIFIVELSEKYDFINFKKNIKEYLVEFQKMIEYSDIVIIPKYSYTTHNECSDIELAISQKDKKEIRKCELKYDIKLNKIIN